MALLDEEWQYELRSDPEMATTVGETRYNDRLTDRSPEFQQSDVEAKTASFSRGLRPSMRLAFLNRTRSATI